MKENKAKKLFKLNKLICVVIFFSFVLYCMVLPQKVMAQNAISLSITPPILEVAIMPGKEYKQTYKITNSGSDVILTPKIYYFEPNDQYGNINITQTYAPEWIKYAEESFTLKNNQSKDFNILVSPSEDVPEADHYFSLVFETSPAVDVLNQNSTLYSTQIASNILVTVSKDDNFNGTAEIVEFSAPKIVDSYLGSVKYKLVVRNTGDTFWKPNGKIIVKDTNLKIAEQNILSNHQREVSCVENEALLECQLANRPILGVIDSEVEFTAGENPKIYNSSTKTYILPITPTLAILILLTLTRSRFIFKLWRKRR